MARFPFVIIMAVLISAARPNAIPGKSNDSDAILENSIPKEVDIEVLLPKDVGEEKSTEKQALHATTERVTVKSMDTKFPTEEAASEKPSKFFFGQGNKCKEVVSKDQNGKVIFSWLNKDCELKPIEPEKPLFNSGFGSLPIPTIPPRLPLDLVTNLPPLTPVN